MSLPRLGRGTGDREAGRRFSATPIATACGAVHVGLVRFWQTIVGSSRWPSRGREAGGRRSAFGRRTAGAKTLYAACVALAT